MKSGLNLDIEDTNNANIDGRLQRKLIAFLLFYCEKFNISDESTYLVYACYV